VKDGPLKEVDFNSKFPIIPHEATGADCIGCVVLAVTGNDAELRKHWALTHASSVLPWLK
jgi:hypothetical protein